MRLLVLANETCASLAVLDEVRKQLADADDDAQVVVVAPALAHSRVGHWLATDLNTSRAEASERLRQSLAAFQAEGIRARGELGDADPLQALDDAVRVLRPDGVIIATHTPERSQWLERRLVERARERLSLPISHVVVDLEFEREHGRSARAADRSGTPAAARA